MGKRREKPQILRNGSKRMSDRKRGGQPGNENAMKHGRFSVRKRAERRAIRQAGDAERERRHAEWMATIPKTDYGAICARIAGSTRVVH
jgi:hypothetical protein